MKKHSPQKVLVACLFATALIAPQSAVAKPNGPINAAQTSSGEGCLVRDASGAYHYDATCDWHVVYRRNRDGVLVMYSYQDHGQLPEGAPHPTSASRHTGPWPGCIADEINEVTTPSGEYRSDCRFRD
jgi:hypothetical protein